MTLKNRILVAPLNWGLGHATRCIPIINALIKHHFEPIIAGDGEALQLLIKEFPTLICLELPTYNMSYSNHGFLLKWHLLKKAPHILKAIHKEHQLVKNIIKDYNIKGIISDNRFGVYSKNKAIPSVYITHQLQVLSVATTWLTTKIHQAVIKKYDECWIPDFKTNPNFSGTLGHIKNSKLNLQYMGLLSRFSKTKAVQTHNLMVLLSGPEPQRTLLENKLLLELKTYRGSVIFVRGVIEKSSSVVQKEHLTIYNFMQSKELEQAIQKSQIIISRSGYTSIMDFATLEKKVFFIPTPGQEEQLYLAKRLESMNIAPYCKQDEFNLEKLKRLDLYSGFSHHFDVQPDFEKLFRLFKSE